MIAELNVLVEIIVINQVVCGIVGSIVQLREEIRFFLYIIAIRDYDL